MPYLSCLAVRKSGFTSLAAGVNMLEGFCVSKSDQVQPTLEEVLEHAARRAVHEPSRSSRLERAGLTSGLQWLAGRPAQHQARTIGPTLNSRAAEVGMVGVDSGFVDVLRWSGITASSACRTP